MKRKNQPWLILTASMLFIVISTLVHPENSTLLGVVQTLLLGVGMAGCCMAIWSFSKGSKKK